MRSAGGACAQLDAQASDGSALPVSVTINRLGEGYGALRPDRILPDLTLLPAFLEELTT